MTGSTGSGGRLPGNSASTSPAHEDARLRGRTYSVPFDRVWRAVLRILKRRPRWEFTAADDAAGTIQVEMRSPLIAMPAELTIRVALDRDAQTRVDARAVSKGAKRDFGMNARRIASLLGELDEELAGG